MKTGNDIKKAWHSKCTSTFSIYKQLSHRITNNSQIEAWYSNYTASILLCKQMRTKTTRSIRI